MDEEVALLLLDRWVTLTYFRDFTEPIGQYCYVSFANVCDSYSQLFSLPVAIVATIC